MTSLFFPLLSSNNSLLDLLGLDNKLRFLFFHDDLSHIYVLFIFHDQCLIFFLFDLLLSLLLNDDVSGLFLELNFGLNRFDLYRELPLLFFYSDALAFDFILALSALILDLLSLVLFLLC